MWIWSHLLRRCKNQQNEQSEKARRKLTKGETLQVRRKEKDRITDTWGSIISSSCLWSRDRAWPADVSCPLAGVRSSAYTRALDPPPQIYP